MHQPCHRTKRSRRKSVLINPRRRNLLKDLALLFDLTILAQLTNIPACITQRELLRLLKEMREALMDALADSESFLTQVPSIPTDDNGASCPQCHMVQHQVPCITFTLKDILLKDNRHDRPLYYSGYMGSTHIKRIQIDPRSALGNIPKRLLYFLGIPLSRLSTTTKTIYDFNTGVVILWARVVSDAKLDI